MKVKSITVVLCLFLLLGLGGCAKPQNTPGPSSTAAEKPELFQGVVIDATMSSVVIRSDESGHTYQFNTADADMELGSHGLIIGETVEVTYLPPLTDGAVARKVKLVEAASPSAPQTSSPSSTPAPTKKPATAGNPPASYQAEAKKILSTMTTEEKVGQMFFVRCPASNAVSDIGKYYLGGYILFARDFENKNKQQVTDTIASYQKAAKINLLIGVDEEGGTVNRVSRYKAFRGVPFRSPQYLYQNGGFDLVKSDTKEKAELLSSLGINVNFAPVCDVSTHAGDYIYARTFGKDGAQTAQYVQTVVSEMKANGMGSVLKHFPGYGPNKDTHVGFSQDNRPYSTFESSDFLPFKAGIQAGADSVLVCHNLVSCIDSTYPASLSESWHGVLRNQLGFGGVIMTDDLAMDAIKDKYGVENAGVLAVKAGNDIILSTDYTVQIPAVIQAVSKGEITTSRLDESVLRILCWKLSQGIIQP